MNYKNHTKEELDVYADAADTASDAAYVAAINADAANVAAANADAAYAYAAADAAADSAAAADAAAAAINVDAANADAEDKAKYISYMITKYFKTTGEDKALYEAEIERINGANNE